MDTALHLAPEHHAPAHSAEKTKVDIKDLSFYYGASKSLKNITLPLMERKVTAFIGPSGCGKSTLLRTINRMHELAGRGRVEGKVLLDGTDLYGPGVDPVSVRRTIGMVFQRPNPFPT
ncbi:MAG TPA: ATP-binding cassette domain-containing protein, partial [Rhizomicrobium sp.]|nr:ATP-binding cassette domain-containing protein [Rhizomicrobium sp.]